MQPEYENILQIVASLMAGAILGMEREYHSKPAGFRTMILICVSSCLFCILSAKGPSVDRIASNVVVGIGFIGAGVVFKEGATVRGITSAALIWMAAAVGMCIGFQHYLLAFFVVLLVLLVTVPFVRIEKLFDSFYQKRLYEIQFVAADYSLEALEKEMKGLQIQFERNKTGKQNNVVIVEYNMVVAPKRQREKIDNFLINNSHVKGFEVGY